MMLRNRRGQARPGSTASRPLCTPELRVRLAQDVDDGVRAALFELTFHVMEGRMGGGTTTTIGSV